MREGVEELTEIAELVQAAGYGPDRIRIDPSVVRGLEYYTGPVFEAELTFEVKDDDGRPVRFGSVGGGGRYDGLVARFRGEPVPATGFSIGVSRLLAALRAIKSPIVAAAETPGPVVVLVLDRDAASMANYQRLVASLRKAGIAAELYLGSGGMNAQLKYADRRRSRVAVIQGSNERDAAAVRRSRSAISARRRTRQGDQGPRRLSRTAPARPVIRARGRTGRTRARGAGARLNPSGIDTFERRRALRIAARVPRVLWPRAKGARAVGLHEAGISLFAGSTVAMIVSGALPFSTQSTSAVRASNLSSARPSLQWVMPGTANRRTSASAFPSRLALSLSYQRIVSSIEKTGSAWP